jgi:two-component system phosphate regulon sensor histidine kinase PhoR
MTSSIIALLFNGLTLALALGLLILVVWQDPSSEANRYFSLFLFMMIIWASGALLGRAAAYVNAGEGMIQMGLHLLEIGFSGASVSIYIYSAVLTGVRGRLFHVMSLAGLGVIFAYQVLLLVTNAPRSFEVIDSGTLVYGFGTTSTALYLAFQASTIVLVWRNRLKIRTRALVAGILLFSAGQMSGLLSPRLRMLGLSEDVSAVAALVISYSVVRQQIMVPLLGRAKQLEAVRDVGLAVTSRLHLQETLSTIAAQAAGLLDADGAAIFLKRGATLELAAVFNLPEQFAGVQVPMGQGVVGTVAVERHGRRIDNYRRDWKGESDLPLAREAFGAVACVPLMFASEVVGVLFVVQGRQGRLFSREDVHLLELLGPQAAVAITNSRLFEAERQLSSDLAAAKDQLEVVLTSTENPVVAVDRQFRIIFANPAALKLLETGNQPVGGRIVDLVPPGFLPCSLRRALRDLRERGVHIYEVAAHERTYLCHVAELGKPRLEGWVAVLNDVTQLKELDRLKNQMIQMTSHDLKNPLQAAMSYIELLTEDGDRIFTEDMNEYIKIIWTQLTRMYRIINGILDLERIQSGTLALEECALEDLLGRAVVDLADQARGKGLTLELEIKEKLPLVLGDPQQLNQAFANLVDNAVKFTPPGGQVFVRAQANRKQVCIDVADTGIGIPAEDRARVFDRFYRGRHQGVVHASGSGLGLSLVKAIIDNHRGDIELESESGKGTIVHVRLPALNETD